MLIGIIGFKQSDIESIEILEKLDKIIEFRGEIAHRVRADTYVKIDQVNENKELIINIAKEVDKKVIAFFGTCYPGKRIWYESY